MQSNLCRRRCIGTRSPTSTTRRTGHYTFGHPQPPSAAASSQRTQFRVRVDDDEEASDVTRECAAYVNGILEDSDGGVDNVSDVVHADSDSNTEVDDSNTPTPSPDVDLPRQRLVSGSGRGYESTFSYPPFPWGSRTGPRTGSRPRPRSGSG